MSRPREREMDVGRGVGGSSLGAVAVKLVGDLLAFVGDGDDGRMLLGDLGSRGRRRGDLKGL
jgi:hypothetical protein